MHSVILDLKELRIETSPPVRLQDTKFAIQEMPRAEFLQNLRSECYGAAARVGKLGRQAAIVHDFGSSTTRCA
jgi:hypothetical protein